MIGAYTIEFWLKLNSEISSGVYEIMHLENNTDKHVIYLQYEYNGGTRRLRFSRDRWLVFGWNAYYNVTLGTSLWHHIAFTRNAGGTANKIFFDGVEVADSGVMDDVAGNTTTGTNIIFGAGYTAATTSVINYANIKIDEIRLWTVDKTASEILANMQIELTGSEPNLVEYLRLNDGSGTTATATVGTNASLVNTPTWSTDIPFIYPLPGGGSPIFFGNTAIA